MVDSKFIIVRLQMDDFTFSQDLNEVQSRLIVDLIIDSASYRDRLILCGFTFSRRRHAQYSVFHLRFVMAHYLSSTAFLKCYGLSKLKAVAGDSEFILQLRCRYIRPYFERASKVTIKK